MAGAVPVASGSKPAKTSEAEKRGGMFKVKKDTDEL
jgi:hypothetical protein